MTRIVEDAHINLLSLKPRKLKPKRHHDPSLAADHDTLISCIPLDSAIAYTDGSASPNPGPSGGGASIFVQSSDQVIDCGVSLGLGSNNRAELHALGICFAALLKLPSTHPHVKRAVVFSDSKLAINAATSVRLPVTNANVIFSLRAMYATLITKLAITLRWIPGHAGIGGNERVDKLSKIFALGVATLPFTHVDFSSDVTRSEWGFFPLRGVPINCFVNNLPIPSGISATGVVASSSTNASSSGSPADMFSDRVQPIPSSNESNVHGSPAYGREPFTMPCPRTLRKSTRLQSTAFYRLPGSVPHVRSTIPSSYSDELDHKHCD